MEALITRFVRDEQGQDLIEYALLGSFVSLAVYVGADFLGIQLNDWYDAVGDTVDTAAGQLPSL